MGMGYGACIVDVIEPDAIKKICNQEWQVFESSLLANEDYDNLGAFAEEYASSGGGCGCDTCESFDLLLAAFKRSTGLELGIGYHNSDDNGDRYDDVNGVYFWVDGMYQLTPEGATLKDVVERKSFVTFG